MIGMYQQALQQILDFRSQYFKEAMDMQMNLMRERESLYSEQQRAFMQNMMPGDYNKQASEMSQLLAVKEQLNKLMNQASYQGPTFSEQKFTPIMNPSVQSNLNNLIKS